MIADVPMSLFRDQTEAVSGNVCFLDPEALLYKILSDQSCVNGGNAKEIMDA